MSSIILHAFLDRENAGHCIYGGTLRRISWHVFTDDYVIHINHAERASINRCQTKNNKNCFHDIFSWLYLNTVLPKSQLILKKGFVILGVDEPVFIFKTGHALSSLGGGSDRLTIAPSDH